MRNGQFFRGAAGPLGRLAPGLRGLRRPVCSHCSTILHAATYRAVVTWCYVVFREESHAERPKSQEGVYQLKLLVFIFTVPLIVSVDMRIAV